MVKKKETKKSKPVKETKDEDSESGMSLDDAFGDDDDVEYAKPKPKKEKKKKLEDDEELEEEIDEVENISHSNVEQGEVEIKQSKPISKLKKGDKVKVDGKEYEVDAHIVLMDHGTTKEMALEIFDSKADRDFQLRYFDDQVESTLELYELQEILYVKRPFSKVEW